MLMTRAKPTAPARSLLGHVLIQGGPSDIDELAALSDRSQSGILLTGSDSPASARTLIRRGYSGSILLDAGRYAGNSRSLGSRNLDPRWIDHQRALGAPSALTDSGYVGRGDHKSLVNVLSQAANLGPGVTALLPINPSWLNNDLERLRAEIRNHDVPIAVALEHRADPLGARQTMSGLVSLLQEPVPVALIRTDVSAIGAVAFGASWSAIGLRTSLRHIYPIVESSGVHAPSMSALLPAALSFLTLGKIAAGYAATSDDPAWICNCSVCGGRTLDSLLYRPDQANAHSFEVLLDILEHTTRVSVGEVRRQSWRAQCASALFYFDSLHLRGLAWRQTANLKHWRHMR